LRATSFAQAVSTTQPSPAVSLPLDVPPLLPSSAAGGAQPAMHASPTNIAAPIEEGYAMPLVVCSAHA
jgi:hypothetical protein